MTTINHEVNEMLAAENARHGFLDNTDPRMGRWAMSTWDRGEILAEATSYEGIYWTIRSFNPVGTRPTISPVKVHYNSKGATENHLRKHFMPKGE